MEQQQKPVRDRVPIGRNGASPQCMQRPPQHVPASAPQGPTGASVGPAPTRPGTERAREVWLLPQPQDGGVSRSFIGRMRSKRPPQLLHTYS